jgi:hypothetical protein
VDPAHGGRAMSAWQPIETAPKDVDVLVYLFGAAIPIRVAMLCPGVRGEGVWVDTGCNTIRSPFFITHWMPLPEPPK